jgi:hypothetical protein
MNKRIARLLRRGADKLDPPEPQPWAYTPCVTTTAGSNLTVTYRQ